MKKLRKLICLLAALACLALITSCGGDNSTEPPENGSSSDEGYFYREGTTVRIVRSTDSAISVSDVSAALTSVTGRMPNLITDASEAGDHELVIGSTNREVSILANEFIADTVQSGKEMWCIYANGGSVAVAWSVEDDRISTAAILYLIENYLTESELKPTDGLLHYEQVDMAAMEAEREAAKRESQLAAIEAKLGKDAADAMRDYLTLFDEGFYIWLANLYDTETGALYYSISGRDNEGFLPDIESTTRGYSWLAGCGMLEKYDGSLKKALPEWLQEKLITWLQGLQSPDDGYFYHPQWGKSVNVSRKSRDLDNATSFLTKLGGDILYNTANGYKGVLGAPGASALTYPLEHSTASAVSIVISAAESSLPDYLKDTEKFREYIKDLNWATNSYSSGHILESQAYQIKAAGAEFVKVYEDTMNEIQESVQAKLRAEGKPENGLWEDNVRYNSVNGLMKICSTYTRLEIKINYIEQAFESALSMIELESADASGKSATNIVDIYNPWCCANQLISNERSFGSKDTAAALRTTLTSRAAELIRTTRRKVSIFRKDDGSYGYMSYGVPDMSQGAPVAVKGTNEGDVNGGTIATNTVIGHMCGALGISTPSLYFNSDFEKFMAIIENASPIEKIPATPIQREITFDDDTAGSSTAQRIETNMNGGYVLITADPRGGDGNVLQYVTVPGSNAALSVKPINNDGANLYALEWQMNITESKKNTTVFQITVGKCFMLTVNTTSDGYTLGDSSSYSSTGRVDNSYSEKYGYGEWHTFRVEYTPGTSETVSTSVYVDGKLAFTSNNYFGKNTVTPAEPSNKYEDVRWWALQSADMTVLFDNIVAEKIKVEK